MKKIFVLLVSWLALSANLFAQDNITICHSPATESFAVFASNKDFNKEHALPKPFVYKSETGKMISFRTPDGKTGNAFFIAEEESDNYVFVIHEWWGLNDYIKKEADKIHTDLGVNVIALDLYDGKIATTRDKAGEYMGAVKTDRAKAIIEGAIEFAGDNANIGTIGWCFGGGWSLQTALMAGDKAVACVMYYGMPEKDVTVLKTLNAPVLGIFAKKDGWITPQVVDNFKKNMADAGKELDVKMYDAVHAFANPSNPDYDKEASADAYQYALDLFKENFK
ncbi:MAG TPA: dienelactone hydrolase family protein [Fulvivirga sp.]|nr:dienelactone hydrolase family protein [Fulvivirga sp.]